MYGAKTAWTGLVVWALGAGAAAAETAKENWPTFRQADRDASGALSIDEVRDVPVLADSFGVYDRNSDGKLSRSEYEAAKRAANESAQAGEATGTGAHR